MNISGMHAWRQWLAGAVFAVVPATLVLAHAAEPAKTPATQSESPLQDPWVPPALRNVEPATPTRGADLQAQVERKIHDGFTAATAGKNKTGEGQTLTRAQAEAAGLGFVVKHFEQIDRTGAGAVTFDDVRNFLRSRNAQQVPTLEQPLQK